MDFRTALESLYYAGEVNAREFVDYVERKKIRKSMPVKNASHCLSRLFKMGLANRRKDRRKNKKFSKKKKRKKPYLYRINNQGKRYLKWFKDHEIDRQLTELEKGISSHP